MLLAILAVVCGSLLVAAAAKSLSPRSATIVDRLEEIVGVQTRTPEESRFTKRLTDAFMRIGRAAPKPVSEMGKLRGRLLSAGYRAEEALILFVGIRVGCALAFFSIASLPFMMRASLMTALGAAAIGYVLPGMVLARLAKRRQHRMRLSLPDALDLLVVSVEAGLGLDQAVQRVADELGLVHPELSEELRLVHLEVRAGTARARAPEKLAATHPT